MEKCNNEVKSLNWLYTYKMTNKNFFFYFAIKKPVWYFYLSISKKLPALSRVIGRVVHDDKRLGVEVARVAAERGEAVELRQRPERVGHEHDLELLTQVSERVGDRVLSKGDVDGSLRHTAGVVVGEQVGDAAHHEVAHRAGAVHQRRGGETRRHLRLTVGDQCAVGECAATQRNRERIRLRAVVEKGERNAGILRLTCAQRIGRLLIPINKFKCNKLI